MNNVLSYPTDTTDHTRVRELRIDIDQLKLIANQWLLGCELYCPSDNYSSKTTTLLMIKVNFRLLDRSGTQLFLINANHQSRAPYSNNVTHPQFITTLFRLLNFLTDSPHAKWIAICHYTFNCFGAQMDDGFAKLHLIPLDSKTGLLDRVSKKFPNVMANGLVVSSTLLGNHQRTDQFSVLSNSPSQKQQALPPPPGSTYKKLTQQESPWLECTRTTSINSIRLDIEDEYRQYIKPVSQHKKI